MVTKVFRTAIALIGLIVLSGCTATPSTAPPTPTAGATTADPEPTTAVGPLYNGDCHAMLTDDDVSRATGETQSLEPAAMQQYAWVVDASGGILCSWTPPDPNLSVTIVALPAAGFQNQIASTPAIVPSCASDTDRGMSTCFSVVTDDVWLSGLVYGAASEQTAAAMSALLTERPVPAVDWTTPAGTWTTVTDCPALGASVDSAGILGGPALDTLPLQTTNSMAAPGFQAALAGAATAFCYWSVPGSPSSDLGTYSVAGAGPAVVAGASAPDREAVQVDGASVAYIVHDSSPSLYATDGANAVAVRGGLDDPARAAKFAAAVLAGAGRH